MEKQVKPIIGITMDTKPSQTANPYPYYALKQPYMDAVVRAGGLPIALPWNMELIPHYTDLIDGLVITGGDDINPDFYGEYEHHPTVTCIPKERSHFELGMTDAVLKKKKPILGICNGMQVLNVWDGGNLYQDISHHKEGEVHKKHVGVFFCHEARVKPVSWLHEQVGRENFYVSSAHHQVLKDVGPNFEAVAWSDDGVIEAIEYKHQPFVIGVEWHPEYPGSPWDDKLWKSWIKACEAT